MDGLRKVVRVVVVDPAAVTTEDSLLAAGLRMVGVEEAFPFRAFLEPEGEKKRLVWQWVFGERSKDGSYETAKLIDWWRSEAWLAENPTHEWALVKQVLTNFAVHAQQVRETPQRLVVRHGKLSAHIPENLPVARKQRLLDILFGRKPWSAPLDPALDPKEAYGS